MPFLSYRGTLLTLNLRDGDLVLVDGGGVSSLSELNFYSSRTHTDQTTGMGKLYFRHYSNMACQWQVLRSPAGFVQCCAQRAPALSRSVSRDLQSLFRQTPWHRREWIERRAQVAWL